MSAKEVKLPNSFSNVIESASSNLIVVRSNVKNLEDCNKWVKEYGTLNNTRWNSRSSKPSGKRFVCSKKFVCHHSNFMKVPDAANKRSFSKNLECLANINIKVKLETAKTKRSDSFLQKGLLAVITINDVHTHSLNTAEALQRLPTSECKEKFIDYFNDGMGIAESCKYHEGILQLDDKYAEEDMANSQINPPYRTVQYWYNQWRIENLGPRTGQGLIEAMDPKNQDSNIEVKQCSVLLERMELDKSKSKKISPYHMNSYSERSLYNCIVCEKSFETYQPYRKHVRIHIKGRPYSCADCGASFPVPRELRRHIRYRHTQEKPYRCTECNYACVEFSKLKRHMQCHTKEHPYKRTFRVSASTDVFKLKHNLLVHTGEKSYECDICQAQFTQSRSLKAHKIIHSENKPSFPCDFCPLISRRKADLLSHALKLHSNDMPIKCKRCEKTLPDRYLYKDMKLVNQDLNLEKEQSIVKIEKIDVDESDPSNFLTFECSSSVEEIQCEKDMKLVNKDLSIEEEQSIEKIHVDEFNDDKSDSLNLLTFECSSSGGKIKSGKDMKLVNQDLNVEKEPNIIIIEKIDVDEFDEDESEPLNSFKFECSSSGRKIQSEKV